jgi:heptosyltransferase-2
VSCTEKVLVIGPNWVGDAVMSTPALANLRQAWPKATIELLVPPRVAPLFEESPHIDRVRLRNPRAPWRDRYASVRELRRVEYDVALVLPNSFRAALWARMIRARARVGYASDGRRALLTHPVAAERAEPVHQVEAYLRLVEALGIPVVYRVPMLVPSARAEAEADRLWTAHGLHADEGVVGLCPGAAFGPAKRWWPERFAALADRLVREQGVRIVLFGSADESALVEEVRSRMTQGAVSLAGQDTLSSFMGLAACCRVLVTNDSGCMHIAAAVGTPVVAIFGPTDPRRTAPLTRSAATLRRDLPCSPCFRPVCPYPDHPCMRSIDVDDAYRAVVHLLGVSS